eukprot:409792_1
MHRNQSAYQSEKQIAPPTKYDNISACNFFKQADKQKEETVTGFIRESQHLLPTNTYYILPKLVNYVVLYYYCYAPLITLTIYFGEYINQPPIQLQIPSNHTIEKTITTSIQQWQTQNTRYKLKGKTSKDYALKCVESDEDDIEIDDECPPFNKQCIISDIHETRLGLQYIAQTTAYATTRIPMPPRVRMPPIPPQEKIFIRILIPGAVNESYVFAIDKYATDTIRDLYPLLNKRRHCGLFHPLYFNLYRREQSKRLAQLIDKTTLIHDIPATHIELLLLPKILTDNDNIIEGYNFELVRLANERKGYICIKIKQKMDVCNSLRSYRLLTVDKCEITKTTLKLAPDQETKDIVLGFIREVELYSHLMVPPLVKELCLKYYHSKLSFVE